MSKPKSSSPGLFISGTDTGVGKTVVSCALARGLRSAGVDIGVMKPAETGVTEAGPEDARALREAAGVDDPISDICPLQYSLPAAPQASALFEGRDVDLDLIMGTFDTLAKRHPGMLVEGAGGLRVPLTPTVDMADLAERLGLPVLLVARASLGTINHTLLSLDLCRAREIEVVGVVVSHAGGPISDADEKNLDLLRNALGENLLGEIPPLSAADDADPIHAGLDRILPRFAGAG